MQARTYKVRRWFASLGIGPPLGPAHNSVRTAKYTVSNVPVHTDGSQCSKVQVADSCLTFTFACGTPRKRDLHVITVHHRYVGSEVDKLCF